MLGLGDVGLSPDKCLSLDAAGTGSITAPTGAAHPPLGTTHEVAHFPSKVRARKVQIMFKY